jgi:hypothetical protein
MYIGSKKKERRGEGNEKKEKRAFRMPDLLVSLI